MGDSIRCAFHQWEYNQEGTCTRTGAGDPPPPGVCLFRFPTAEKYGMIWAFNGEKPLFDLPEFPYPEEDLVLAVRRSEGDEASQRELLDFATRVQQQILADDAPILRTIRFRPGALTKSDRALAQFFEHLRRFPRAHPSVEFIR